MFSLYQIFVLTFGNDCIKQKLDEFAESFDEYVLSKLSFFFFFIKV